MPATMSCGPAMVAMRVRPPSSRCRTAVAAPPTESTSTYGTVEAPSGRPFTTTGRSRRCRVIGSGSAPCIEAIIVPSTCRASRYCWIRSWLSAELAIISTSCWPAASSSWLTPCTRPGKSSLSEKTRAAASGNTNAME